MNVTGKKLEAVLDALELAKDAIDNQIKTCPDPITFAEELFRLNEARTNCIKFITEVEAALQDEEDSK